MDSNSFCQVSFSIPAKTVLPWDNGYFLHSALKGLLLDNGWDWQRFFSEVRFHPISGTPIGDKEILTTATSKLRIIVPDDRAIATTRLLNGKTIRIGSQVTRLVRAHLEDLELASTLYSRCVFFKNTNNRALADDTDRWHDLMESRLVALGIDSPSFYVPSRSDGGPRQQKAKISDGCHRGFSVIVDNLTPQQSRVLQTSGIGASRNSGFGNFYPFRGSAADV